MDFACQSTGFTSLFADADAKQMHPLGAAFVLLNRFSYWGNCNEARRMFLLRVAKDLVVRSLLYNVTSCGSRHSQIASRSQHFEHIAVCRSAYAWPSLLPCFDKGIRQSTSKPEEVCDLRGYLASTMTSVLHTVLRGSR